MAVVICIMTTGGFHMTAANFDRIIDTFRSHVPFQPYIVELVNGEKYEVNHRDALANNPRGGGKAVYSRVGFMRFVNAEDVVLFRDAGDVQEPVIIETA
jgi:hypothetical protein